MTLSIYFSLETQLAERGMAVGAPAQWPMVFALRLADPHVVDAGDAPGHQPVPVEFPVLVAVTAEPLAAIVMPLVGKAHGDPVLAEGPDFLDEAIVEFAIPFTDQEGLDGGAALEELRPVAPEAVGRIGLCHARRLARVPGILGQTRLLGGSLGGERGKRGTVHRQSPFLESCATPGACGCLGCRARHQLAGFTFSS